MAEHPIQSVMETTMNKIREMMNANTVIGDPINLPGGGVILPVSKISLGFASGGSDLPTNTKASFGGGGGAGVNVQPVAFLVISPKGEVKLLEISNGKNTVDKAMGLVPDLVDKIAGLVSKKDEAEESSAETEGEEAAL